ncbi:MAG: response regulator transcription factor [Spirochaetia bacterium]|jgi:DNA-binding response OmpR family regulator|nr:response regulator transcription factor [Spirochaetia bacterium]
MGVDNYMIKVFYILLVEDDPQTAQMVRFYLERETFKVIIATDGLSGEEAFRQNSPQLVLLDIMLPGIDGLELCSRIRRKSEVPVLMLTARADDTDKAIGLGIGADDYLTKPFSPVELVARVKALLRRAYQYNDPPRSASLGGEHLRLDSASRTVTLDGRPIDLTPIEFDLLHILMANPGWTFSRNHLMEKVWGYIDGAGEETVTAHVSNLRRKLGPFGSELIRTIHGIGYTYQELE